VVVIGTDDYFFYKTGSSEATADLIKKDGSGNVHIQNNLTISGSLAVSGNFTLGDETTDKIITEGDLHIGNDAFFGDDVTITGDLTTKHIYPTTSGDYDLGSEDKKWRKIYAKTGQFDSSTILLGTDGAKIAVGSDGNVETTSQAGVVSKGLT
jgi:predicted acyltransferase (DUF342 family)